MTRAPQVVHGDCLEIMKMLPDNSVDSIVTDPPYGLGFMGKAWDALPPGKEWAEECLRVLKPGGHLLAFGGSRTWHRLAVAVEDAGFEIRDSIAWLYGSGFPKSLDVSKAIDKAGGVSPEVQARVLRESRQRAGLSREEVAERIGCTPSSVRDWEEGRARATGRPLEFITPSPAYRDKVADLLGYTADERAVTGATLDRRGDGTVIGLGHSGIEYGAPATPAAEQWQGWGTALKPAFEPVVMARKPLIGTVAANVQTHGTGALNIDGCRIGTEGGTSRSGQAEYPRNEDGTEDRSKSWARTGHSVEPINAGRWPANVALDEHMAAVLDEQTADMRAAKPSKSGSSTGEKFSNLYGVGMQGSGRIDGYADSGGASRFFYVAKAPKKERPIVDGVAHATVKPLELMRWLVRLVTPDGGTVLEPFAGSGTTVEACILEGFHCIAIEREAEYLPLIQARIDRQDAA